jgi:hypothetical protein
VTVLSALSFLRRARSSALSGLLLLIGAVLGCGVPEGAAAQDVAQGETTVSIERQEARVGEAVEAGVQVTGFTNIGAISLIVTYDPDVLKFAKDVEAPSLISGVSRENFSANVVEPGELRISWFDSTGSTPISIRDGTLLTITFHRYVGGESAIAFADGSEISTIEAIPVGAAFQDGRVARQL